MKKNLIIFSVLAVLFSCSSKTIYPKPKNLIPKDTMVLLIKDLFYANTARGVKNVRLQRKINYHPLVFKKYKIDSARFYDSNFYYTSTIDDYDEILTQVLTKMEADEKKYIEMRKAKDSIYNDSIKLLKSVRY